MTDARYTTTCCICGAMVDTLEVSDGGSEDGCQLANDEWVCSRECWDAVAGPPAQEMIPKDAARVAIAIEALNTIRRVPVGDGDWYSVAMRQKQIASAALAAIRRGDDG